MDKFESVFDCGHVEHGEKALGELVVSGGDGAVDFEMADDARRFRVLPKRWIVERTFAWINRNRRLMRDFERYARTVVAFVRLAMIRLMLKRLAAKPSS